MPVTPPPMNTSADFERWQPGVDSAPGMSLYADGPSASVFDDAPLVLPAQRPASPEIAESPSATTVCAWAAAGTSPRAAAASSTPSVRDPLIRGIGPDPRWLKLGHDAGVLAVEIDPKEAGFDAARLKRIDRYFQRYVDDGRLPGFLAVIARDGRVVHLARAGARDVEAGLPVETDTLWRIFSMTKPITSVAAMMLWEEGAFELKDPIERFIPSFADMRVWHGGSPTKPVTVPAAEPIRVWHLLTPTSGLTYGFHHAPPLDAMDRQAGYEWGSPPDRDLAANCDAWAELPLLFQPGAAWNYSVSTDVLGRLVEVLSGLSLDAFFEQRIFDPLGMTDTAFGTTEKARLRALSPPREWA